MARIILDPQNLPENHASVPGAKPPVYSLPYEDLSEPEEVDIFLDLIRHLRQQAPSREH